MRTKIKFLVEICIEIMCGRFSRFIGSDSIERRYMINEKTDTQPPPSYNVAPSQKIPVISKFGNKTLLKTMTWGYPSRNLGGKQIINGRSETLTEKTIFSSAIKTNRILIPATGFYEWKAIGNSKIPYHIQPDGFEIFSFAGLFIDDKVLREKFAIIITTSPSEEMREIHDRMPVILDAETEDSWIDNSSDLNYVLALLKPYKGRLIKKEVSMEVNSPLNDHPGLLENDNDDQKSLDDFF